jgi:hypothetical protein
MTRRERQILQWLKDGARIWCPFDGRLAYVCLPTGHKDDTRDGPQVKRRTLEAMEEQGLVENKHGEWNDGSLYADNIWALPGAPNPASQT